jgi:hypothetical protein
MLSANVDVFHRDLVAIEIELVGNEEYMLKNVTECKDDYDLLSLIALLHLDCLL